MIKMINYRSLSRAKPIILSTVTLVAVFFVVYSDKLITNVSVKHSIVPGKEISELREQQAIILKPTTGRMQLRAVSEAVTEVDMGKQLHPLVPPVNVTEDERIAWFRQSMAKFDILKLDDLSMQFRFRVSSFFDHECTVRFFMTWISPTRLFGSREFLAIESIFKANSNGCLVILSRTMDSKHGNKILKPLVDLGFKVIAVTPDLPYLFKNTPAETWYKQLRSGKMDPGEIPLAQNLSNLMRLVVLYKYGGVYLDADIIVLKGFEGLRNAIGAQSEELVTRKWTRLNNAVLVFDKHHQLLLKFIEEFASTFDGNKWGHNGPYLVSRVVERLLGQRGYNFSVLPPMAFYPVGWIRIDGLFKRPGNRAEQKWVEAKLLQLSNMTYGVHFWNKQSKKLRIEEGSVMDRLISKHCVICKRIYTS